MMKFLCSILTIVALIGSALGDLEGGNIVTETPAGSGHVCDVQLVEGKPPIDILMDVMLECVGEEAKAAERAINHSHTTEEYQQIVKTFCDKLPTISTCTANIASKVHLCLNESQTATFKVIRNNFDTALTVGCEENGITVAAIIEEYRNLHAQPEKKSTVNHCLSEIEDDIKTLDLNDTASKTSVSRYRMLNKFKMCIQERGQGQVILLNILVESLAGDLMQRLECIHPESHIEVLCESIVAN